MLLHQVYFRERNLSATPAALAGGNLIALTEAKLWGLKIRRDANEPQLRHGAVSGPSLLEPREITLEGVILAQSEAERDTLMKTLDALFSPPLQDDLDETYTLQFTDGGGFQWQVETKIAEPLEKKYVAEDPTYLEWSVTLSADDPRIYSTTETVQTDVNRTQGLNLPASLGASFTQSWCEVAYGGTLAQGLVATIVATADNASDGTVRFENLTTDKSLVITETTLNSGDTLVIDTVNRIITLNDEDITLRLTDESEWIMLEPGTNRLRLDTNIEYIRTSVEYTFNAVWI